MKIFVLVVFILTYAGIIAFPQKKPYIAGIAAVLSCGGLIVFGQIDVLRIFSAIDYNVVLMLLGMMVTVSAFSYSKMPDFIADRLISKMPNALAAVVFLSVLSGFISAFIDNVATVLMLAPIGISVALKTKVSPVPVIISIAVSSNLQGAATLVGDTTSIMLGSFADMNFFEFFFLNGKFSIFWAVELGAVLTIPVIIFIFRKHREKLVYESEKVEVRSVVPTVLLLSNIVALVAVSFIPADKKIGVLNGVICAGFALVTMLFTAFKYKKEGVKSNAKEIDISTVFFLIFLFMIIAAVENVGLIQDISELFKAIGAKDPFLLYTVIVVGSMVFSAFIDNIPFVATMLPVIKTLTASLTAVSPYLLYFGLLCGATLGGNLTPVGASANVVGIGTLNKAGYKVKNSDFFKIGVPFTLVAVFGGYIFCWFVWGI
ncbi:MAG: anion permease [Clostridia bacterium]|nr:anion permease [Clostridia bacterium]